jgi:signal transduction histidine kinase
VPPTHRPHTLPLLACALVSGLAGTALLGWLLDDARLNAFHAGYRPMAPHTAGGLIALSGIIGLGPLCRGATSRRIWLLTVGVPFVTALWVLGSHLGLFPELGELMIAALGRTGALTAARMSAVTATAFLVLAAAIVASQSDRSGPRVFSVVGGLAVTALGLVVVVGYLLRRPLFDGTEVFPVALPTGIAFALLGAAWVATLGPRAPLVRAFTGTSVQAVLLRAFLPGLIVLVLAMRIGSQYALTQSSGNPVWLFALLAIVSAAVMAGMVALVSKRIAAQLEAAEAARLEAVAATHLAQTRVREEQLSKLVAIGRIASGLAHEINNPLGFVRSNLQFIQGELTALPLTPEQSEEIAGVLVETMNGLDRIADVSRELRTCAPAATGLVLFEDVAAALNSALDRLPRVRGDGVRVIREIGPTSAVSCDPELFNRVIDTLVRNAAEATVRANTLLEVHVRLSQAGGLVCLEVDDNGAGISAELAGQIFDPFLSIKPNGKGRGLSLASSHALVRAAGGTLSVSAIASGGSRFAMCLPSQLIAH